MVTQLPPCACSTAIDASPPAPPSLRDRVAHHAASLEQLLAQQLRLTRPDQAPAFERASAHAATGARHAAWLCGVALWLLRADGGPDAPPGFARRLSQALPGDIARPLIALARSPLSDLDCTTYLSRPGAAVARACPAPAPGR